MRDRRIASPLLLVAIIGFMTSPTLGDLIAHYSMNEGQGGMVLDRAGAGNHGSISGATWTTGMDGAALSFDGVDDYVVVDDRASLNPTGAITVMAWVKWDIDPLTGNNWASIVNKNADNQYRLHHNHSNTAFEFAIRTTAGGRWVIGTTTPEEDRWYHVAGTYDGSHLCIYVDGMLDGSVAHSGSLLASNSSLDIGRRAIANDRYFAGSISDVRIYDYALTSEEVAAIVPEPATMSLLGLGLGSLLVRRRKAHTGGGG